MLETWERIFLANGQVRPIWRFFLSAVMIGLAYVGVAIILGVAFGILGRRPTTLVSLFWVNLLMLGPLLGIFQLLTAVFERKPLGSTGLALCGRWKMELGMGLGVGACMIFLVVGLERLLGLATFAWSSRPADEVVASGAFFCLGICVSAITEEMTFRGYPFQRLEDSLGPVGAVALTSALFGLAHLGNPSRTWISTFNTMLVGIPLAVAYLRTRALWLPIGIHFSWNFFQGYGLGLPVSGLVFPESVLKPAVARVPWLTGGSYGPEGGLLASAAIGAATIYLFFSKSIYISEDMRALAFGPTFPREADDVVLSRPASADPKETGSQESR